MSNSLFLVITLLFSEFPYLEDDGVSGVNGSNYYIAYGHSDEQCVVKLENECFDNDSELSI